MGCQCPSGDLLLSIISMLFYSLSMRRLYLDSTILISKRFCRMCVVSSSFSLHLLIRTLDNLVYIWSMIILFVFKFFDVLGYQMLISCLVKFFPPYSRLPEFVISIGVSFKRTFNFDFNWMMIRDICRYVNY